MVALPAAWDVSEYDLGPDGDWPGSGAESQAAVEAAIRAAVHRRRLAAAASAAYRLGLRSGGQGPQGKKVPDPAPFSWTDHVARLTEAQFKQRYRLTFDGF